MSRTVKFVLLAVALLMLVSIPLAMQFESGSLTGVISDQRGPVRGAAVEARNVVTGVARHSETDSEGLYQLKGIRPGRYSLWVKAEGYDSVWIAQIVIYAGQTLHRDLRLTRCSPEYTSVTCPGSDRL